MDTATLNEISRGYWSDAFRRLRKRKLAMVCFAVIIVYAAIAGFVWIGDLLVTKLHWKIPLVQWNQQVGANYQKPMAEFDYVPELQTEKVHGWSLLGTDFLGQSTLRKTIYGAKTAIMVALCASLISILIGVPLGAIAGYYRGWVDDAIVWFYTTLGTIPYILLLMAFAVVLRNKTICGVEIRGSTAVFLAIGLTSWVGLCRLIRGEIIKRKESEYVLAARAMGCSDFRILFVHLLPNVFHIILINFSLRFVGFIHAEVILSFLGLGETDKPSWGAMIDAARTELARDVWWEMAAATVAIFIISLALNIFSDALRDCLDPKLRMD
jgi:ABC-type dipeptide/oligopeptide/nickel transport system permease subunit